MSPVTPARPVGIWSAGFVTCSSRAILRYARGLCGALADLKGAEYLAIRNIFYDSGMVTVEISPLGAYLTAILRGFCPTDIPSDYIPANSLSTLLSFDCFDHIWEWPLRRFGIRSACVVHDLMPLLTPDPAVPNRQTQFFLRLTRVVDAADILICQSHHTADDLAIMFPAAGDKLQVVLPGHRAASFGAVRSSSKGGRSDLQDRLVVLMVGPVEAHSNFERVLVAVPRIANSGSQTPAFVIAGGEPNRTDPYAETFHNALREAQQAAAVTVTGNVTEADIIELYRSADLFMAPSFCDGSGFLLLEALSAGLAVIANDTPFNREICGGFVTYVDAADPDEIAEGIIQLASALPGQRKSAACISRKLACSFTWNRAADACDRLLRADIRKTASSGVIEYHPLFHGHITDLFVFTLIELLRPEDGPAGALRTEFIERAAEDTRGLGLLIRADFEVGLASLVDPKQPNATQPERQGAASDPGLAQLDGALDDLPPVPVWILHSDLAFREIRRWPLSDPAVPPISSSPSGVADLFSTVQVFYVADEQSATDLQRFVETPSRVRVISRAALSTRAADRSLRPPDTRGAQRSNDTIRCRLRAMLQAAASRLLGSRRQQKIGGYIRAGDDARDSRDWPSAEVHYRAALYLDPHHSAIWVQLGHALKEQGKIRDAESAYRKALLLDHRNADTYLQLGHALKMQERQAEAADAYLEALFYDPDCLPARHELTAFGHSTDIIRDALRHRFASSSKVQSPVSSGS